MTNKEFSDQFDTLLNSYAITIPLGEQASKAEITLDEYEKSVFLTQAQEDLILALYNGKNPYGEAFENTEELRRYLSDLIMEETLTPTTKDCNQGINAKSKLFDLPGDLWFITYEAAKINAGKCGEVDLDVIPVTQDEYHRVKRNPFRGANGKRALRLDLSFNQIELVSDYTITSYYIRYIKRIHPIILTDLPDDLSIKGENKETPCELHEAIHNRILEYAVRLALQSRGRVEKAES